MTFLSRIGDFVEVCIMACVKCITSCMPVKVIRDENGTPFLYRYHLFACTKNGPGICFHRFVKSDPNRGFHDHPWERATSFILSGRYFERLLTVPDKITKDTEFDPRRYREIERSRFTFNHLKGRNAFHRVMVRDQEEAWTIFFFSKRAKIWGMVDLEGKYHDMSFQTQDSDGGWWKEANVGTSINSHLPLKGNVQICVDIIVKVGDEYLFIQRGKEPYKDYWAFPGGRVERDDKYLEDAAVRELAEETSVRVQPKDLVYITLVGNSKRDPRGFVASAVFMCHLDEKPCVKAGDDAVNYTWATKSNLPKLAFDHEEILSTV